MLIPLYTSAQDTTNFYAIFGGDPPKIPLDSITKQLIHNDKLIGKWTFSKVKVENKSLSKLMTERSKRIEYHFSVDHKLKWINDQDTANLYWELKEVKDYYTVNVYQPLEDGDLHGSAVKLTISKLSRSKMVMVVIYDDVAVLRDPFEVYFKRK